jgi:elongation factor Ts
LREQAATTGKAPKFLDRIVEGRLGRFYEDNCLLDQKFVMEEKLSVQARALTNYKRVGFNDVRLLGALAA